jgi:hypothetical protein
MRFPIFIGIVVALWLLTFAYYYLWDHAVALWTLYRWDEGNYQREDIKSYITNITPTETPFMRSIAKEIKNGRE